MRALARALDCIRTMGGSIETHLNGVFEGSWGNEQNYPLHDFRCQISVFGMFKRFPRVKSAASGRSNTFLASDFFLEIAKALYETHFARMTQHREASVPP